MTFDEYFAKVNGKGIDYDGNYGVQCFDLIIDYDGTPKPSQMYVKYKGKSGGA